GPVRISVRCGDLRIPCRIAVIRPPPRVAHMLRLSEANQNHAFAPRSAAIAAGRIDSFRYQGLSMRKSRRISQISASLLVVAALAACGDKQGAAPAGGMPPPEVGVVTVTPGPLAVSTELPGRL